MEEESDDDVEDDIVMSDDDDDDDDDGSEVTEPTGNIGPSKKISHNNNKNNTVSCTETSPVSVKLDEDISSSYPSRIEALRAKLRAKVAALAGSTKKGAIDGDSGGGTDNPALTSKRAARRAEKKRRMEAAKQRAGKTGSSSVVASADGSNKKRRLDTTTSMGKSSMTASSSSSSAITTTTMTTVANDLATIDYQSLAGLRPKLDGALDNKSLVGIGGMSIPSFSSSNKGKKKASLEKLLADAERKQARLRELKTSTNEVDKERARNIVWQDTFKVASVGSSGDSNNLRKMNDPAVIKKAIKRKSKKKVASAKAWNSRIEKVHDAVSERQRIRSHNIDQRKLGGATAANLSSKRIVTDKDSTATEGGGDGGKDAKGEKRRRLGPHSNRAGFEGKKNNFINGNHQQGDGGGSTSVAASGGGGGKKGGR